MIDSDSQTQRGFVQHRRSLTNGVNGEGQPLPSQVLEGEIAINLATRKLYTKRQKFISYTMSNTVNDFEQNAGFIIDFANLSYDSDSINISYSINGNAKTLVLDSDSNLASVVLQIKNAATAEVGAAQVTSTDTSVTFFRTTGTASITFSSDFVRYIDFNFKPVLRVGLNASASFQAANASTIIDFDLATSGFRRTQGNGRLISHTGATLYLKDFAGIIAAGNKITQREPKDEYEIIEINNVPTVLPKAPEKALSQGNFWIQNRDSESGKLYWLDTSITDDSDFQVSIRQLDSDTKVERNAVVIDSDGNGNLMYGEWRAIVSTSLLGSSGGNTFEGDAIFSNNITIDSDLRVKGDSIFDGDVTINGLLNFDSKSFDDTHAFTIKNVSGTTIISGHLLQTASDVPTPGS